MARKDIAARLGCSYNRIGQLITRGITLVKLVVHPERYPMINEECLQEIMRKHDRPIHGARQLRR